MLRASVYASVPLVSLWHTCGRICVRCQAAAMVPLLSPGMPRLAAAAVPIPSYGQGPNPQQTLAWGRAVIQPADYRQL